MALPATGPLDDRGLKNLLKGAFITCVLMLGIPWLFGVAGWAQVPTGKSWWILAAAAVGVVAKLFASENATGEFEFYKFGYDLCTTALGGIITAAAIQLPSTIDMFPDFGSATFLPTFSTQDASNRVIQLILCFLIALAAVVFTARISRSIKEQRTDPRGGLAGSCAAVGALILCVYALLLAAKD